MEREAGGGIRMGNTCKSMADSCQCMAKTTKYCKVISLQLIKINGKKLKRTPRDFSGGPVVKTPSANAEDTGSIPGPRRFHIPQGN